VNADEAAVLGTLACLMLDMVDSSDYFTGTAFYGASLSRQFKTKPIKVQDAVVRDVYLSYTAEGKGKDGNFVRSLSLIWLTNCTYE
jgi:hypothetical protein